MKASDNKEMHAYALLMYTMIYHNNVIYLGRCHLFGACKIDTFILQALDRFSILQQSMRLMMNLYIKQHPFIVKHVTIKEFGVFIF